MSSMPSSFIQALLVSSGYTFCSYIPYAKFYKVYFGGRKVLAHSLIGNRHLMRENKKTSRALKRKEKIALKLGLRKCE